MMRLALVLALLIMGAGCQRNEQLVKMTVAGRDFRIVPAQYIFELVDTPGPLHPALVEEIFSRPELPFNYNGHEPHWNDARGPIAAELTPALNSLLEEHADVLVVFDGYLLEIVVNKSSRQVMVTWSHTPMLLKDGNAVVFDVSRVPNAFAPEKPLTVDTVRKQLRASRRFQ